MRWDDEMRVQTRLGMVDIMARCWVSGFLFGMWAWYLIT